MKQYIDKEKVVAEIERIKKEECPIDLYEGRCKLFWFEQFLTFINTLEVKEVDNKPKPKFKVGDWCIDNEDGTIFQIVKVLDNTYTYKTNEGSVYSCTHYSLESDARLWTIQDGKPGDVLVCPKYAGDTIPNIFIFKDIKIKDNDVFCYCSFLEIFRTEGYIANADPINTDFYPATKEQCNLLFSEMKEAGYGWNVEKKKLFKSI